MNEQQIKDNAPDGATHYCKSKILSFSYYFKVDGEYVWIWTVSNEFKKTIRKFSEYKDIKPL